MHPCPMIDLLIFALASLNGNGLQPNRPCLPASREETTAVASAVDDHRAIRKILNEPMPDAPTMVMLYGKGGHLATNEYSIIAVRNADGSWQGSAVGRSQVSIVDAPFTPMKKVEWELGMEEGQRLDEAISRRCPSKRPPKTSTPSRPPPRDFIPERIDVVTPNMSVTTFYVSVYRDKFAAMIRPPK